LATGNVNAEFFLQTDRTFDVNTPEEAKGTYNGTAVKLSGTGSIFSKRLVRGDNSHQISMAANATHSMLQLIHNKPIVKTDDTIATLKDIADATSGGGDFLPKANWANTTLANTTYLGQSFGNVGASYSGAVGVDPATGNIRLVTKQNTGVQENGVEITNSAVTISRIGSATAGMTATYSASSQKCVIRNSSGNSTLTQSTTSLIQEFANATGVMQSRLTFQNRGGSAGVIVEDSTGARFNYGDGTIELTTAIDYTPTANHVLTMGRNDARYLAKPATAIADQVLTYNGTAWGAANASSGGLTQATANGLYQPILNDMTYTNRMTIPTIISGINSYKGEVLSNITGVLGVSGGNTTFLNGVVHHSAAANVPYGAVQGVYNVNATGCLTISSLVATDTDSACMSMFTLTAGCSVRLRKNGTIYLYSASGTSSAVEISGTSGLTYTHPANVAVSPTSILNKEQMDAIYLAKPDSLTLPYLTQSVADGLYPTMDGSATGKFAAYTENAPGYTGQYVMPDGKIMTIQNGAIVSIS
jgi:hypothetical protein